MFDNVAFMKEKVFLNIYNPGVKTKRLMRVEIPGINTRLKDLKTGEYLTADIFYDVNGD